MYNTHSLINSLSIFNAINKTSYVHTILLIIITLLYAAYINKNSDSKAI